MEVPDVTRIMYRWLNEGPSSLSTVEDCGWPSRVADVVLANIDRKIKQDRLRSQVLSDSAAKLTVE